MRHDVLGALAFALAGSASAQEVAPVVPPAVSPAVAAEVPPAVPYRPTAANPADLPAPGYAEIEAGYLYSRGGDVAHSASLPVLLKLGLDEHWALLAGTDARARERELDGSTAHSGGDTSIVVKQRVALREGLALGFEYGRTIATARPPVGTGHGQWSVNSIVSADVREVHVDANLAAIRLDAPADGQGRAQAFAALAVSTPLSGQWTLAGDVHATMQRGATPDTTALAALSYALTPQLVFDVAFASRLARAAPDWQVTSGLTWQLGRWR